MRVYFACSQPALTHLSKFGKPIWGWGGACTNMFVYSVCASCLHRHACISKAYTVCKQIYACSNLGLPRLFVVRGGSGRPPMVSLGGSADQNPPVEIACAFGSGLHCIAPALSLGTETELTTSGAWCWVDRPLASARRGRARGASSQGRCVDRLG